jgi:hypothetical protein
MVTKTHLHSRRRLRSSSRGALFATKDLLLAQPSTAKNFWSAVALPPLFRTHPHQKTQPSAKRLRYCFRHAFLPSNRRTNDGDGNKRVIAAPSLAVILRSEATKDLLLARTSPEARAFNPLPPPSNDPLRSLPVRKKSSIRVGVYLHAINPPCYHASLFHKKSPPHPLGGRHHAPCRSTSPPDPS